MMHEPCPCCGARVTGDYAVRHLCKEVILGTAVLPQHFVPFDLPAPPEVDWSRPELNPLMTCGCKNWAHHISVLAKRPSHMGYLVHEPERP